MKRRLSFLLASCLVLPVAAGEIVVLRPTLEASGHRDHGAAVHPHAAGGAREVEDLSGYLEPGRWAIDTNAADLALEARRYRSREQAPPLEGGVVIETSGNGEMLLVAPPAPSENRYNRERARAYRQTGKAGQCNDASSVVGGVEGRTDGQLEINASQKGGGTSASRPCQ